MQASAAKSWYIHEFGNADWCATDQYFVGPNAICIRILSLLVSSWQTDDFRLVPLAAPIGDSFRNLRSLVFLIPVMVFIYRKTLPYSHELRRASSGAAARMPQLKQVGPSCGSTCLSMCLESQGLPMDPQLIETWPQVRSENHPWTRGQVCVFLFKMTKIGWFFWNHAKSMVLFVCFLVSSQLDHGVSAHAPRMVKPIETGDPIAWRIWSW